MSSGDRLGLVGSNGAGKTTLLRVLAGIYEPVLGNLHVKGSLKALLDANLGMNPELTGREKYLLRGLGPRRPAPWPRPPPAIAYRQCTAASPTRPASTVDKAPAETV
ncbi:ABC transporter ATP-binding protein [Lacticaseibacillus rhamnosus]